MTTYSSYLFLGVVEREAAPAGEVRPDGVVIYHHRERPVHRDVGVHQAPELLRVVVSLVSGDDDRSADSIKRNIHTSFVSMGRRDITAAGSPAVSLVCVPSAVRIQYAWRCTG